MTEENDSESALDAVSLTSVLIIVFAVLFATGGAVGPVFYYQYAPKDTFVDVHSIGAEDQPAGTDNVTITINRTTKGTYPTRVRISLVKLPPGPPYDDEHRVASYQYVTIVRQGHVTSNISFATPELSPGTYQFIVTARVTLPHGVERVMVWDSETFQVEPVNQSVDDTNETTTPTPSPPASPTAHTASPSGTPGEKPEVTPKNETQTPKPTPTPTPTSTATAARSRSGETSTTAGHQHCRLVLSQ